MCLRLLLDVFRECRYARDQFIRDHLHVIEVRLCLLHDVVGEPHEATRVLEVGSHVALGYRVVVAAHAVTSMISMVAESIMAFMRAVSSACARGLLRYACGTEKWLAAAFSARSRLLENFTYVAPLGIVTTEACVYVRAEVRVNSRPSAVFAV